MIFGSYPCCDADLAIPVPEKTPAYFRELCPSCGVAVWHRLSRFDPESWTEEDFLKEYRIDEETKNVELINPPVDIISLMSEEEKQAFADMVERQLLYGDPSSEGVPVGLLSGGFLSEASKKRGKAAGKKK